MAEVIPAETPSAPSGGEFGWTISSSSTDPLQNTAPFTPGEQTYFLWAYCADLPAGFPQGIAAAEFGLVSSPSNTIVAFTPSEARGWRNLGSATNLLLFVDGCPCGGLAGTIRIQVNAPGSLCLGPSSTDTKVGVDCSENPYLWPIDWIGLDIGGGPCGRGLLCRSYRGCVIAVDPTTWGRTKARYR
jgi:hypothetical protein